MRSDEPGGRGDALRLALTALLLLGAVAAVRSSGVLDPGSGYAEGPRLYLIAAPQGAWVGLAGGAAVGLVLALLAESRGAGERRGVPLLGAVVAGLGAAVAAPWILLLLASVPARPPAPPGVLVHPLAGRHAELLLAVPAAAALLGPAAFVAIAQALAAAAGRGRAAPLRTAARWTRRGLTAIVACGSALAGLKTDVPVLGIAVFALAAALPLAWALDTARLGGPSARLVLLCAGAGAALGAPDPRASFLAFVALNLALPPLAVALALRRARLDRQGLDALGIEVDAPGDLAAAATLPAPALLALALAVLGRSGEWFLLGAYAVAWMPLLTTAAAVAVVLYLGRVLREGRAQGAALEARREQGREAA